MINKSIINELLKNLGYQNIQVVESPTFYWNGNVVTDDQSAPIKTVGTIRLNDKFNFSDFLNTNSDKKIVIFNIENSEVRAFID